MMYHSELHILIMYRKVLAAVLEHPVVITEIIMFFIFHPLLCPFNAKFRFHIFSLPHTILLLWYGIENLTTER
jgi:hypothetical protein